MSKPLSKESVIPSQQKGAKSDTSISIKFKSEKEAKDFFPVAKDRLLQISNWDKLCGSVTGIFCLTDARGNELNAKAEEGNFIRIDIPGPGSKTGDGYDWVTIEEIKTLAEGNDKDQISIRVRPAQNPTNADKETAHFLKDDATSTFIVIRNKNIVSAQVHGRNELPNIHHKRKFDVIRNFFIAIGAILGFSKTQWHKLVEGIMSSKTV